ncbi:MAG: zinc-binding dehydrogenase [Chloroflexales bacterium]|nr:zinc-binding dehydrogenase [Chloroflexales bacterium]
MTRGLRVVMPKEFTVELVEYDVPAAGANQVVIATEASGISAGTELAIYTGIHQWLKDPSNLWAKFPFIPGYSAVGHIVAVGAGVTQFKEGDRVIWPGRHESYAVVDVGPDADIWPIATHVPAPDAAMLSLARFPFTALVQSQRILGQAVAILGMGMIGQIATRLYAAAGAYPIIGVDAVAQRRAWAEQVYGVQTIDPSNGDGAAQIQALLGRRADVVVDATGVPAALQDALKLVCDGGQVVLVGSPRGIIQNFDSYWDLHGRSVTITGAHGSAIGTTVRDHFPFTRDRALPLLAHFAASGKLSLKNMITHHVHAENAPEMYEGLRVKRDEFLAVTMHW